MSAVSRSQIIAIHALKSRAGLTDADYRSVLFKETKKASSKDLTDNEAGRVIDHLKLLSGQSPGRVAKTPAGRKEATTASGPYAPVLQALWLSAWNLALARSKDDAALLAFVERQTGLEHTRFLIDAGEARKAIEGLKKWLARAGVEWPSREADDPLMRKRAVVKAIAAKSIAVGAFKPFSGGMEKAWPWDFERYGQAFGLPNAMDHYTAENFDVLANRLGARLRGHLAEQARKAKGKKEIAA